MVEVNLLVDRTKHREYMRNFVKTRNDRYLGTVVCPKCGRKGYASRMKKVNIKTGTVSGRFVQVLHKHTEHGKNVYDGSCYIGMVRGVMSKTSVVNNPSTMTFVHIANQKF